MAVQNDPNTAANVARVGDVDTSTGDVGAHVSVRPDPCAALGHYIVHCFTGNMAAAAGALSELVQIRYTGAKKLIIYDILVEHFRSLGTAFAAGNYLFDYIRATGWSVDGTGGALVVPEKVRTSMGAPTTTVRVATTAPLGAGTKTLSTAALRAIRGIVSTGINAHMLGSISAAANITVGMPGPTLLTHPSATAYPLVLAQNEGAVIRATVPGTGVWEAAFTVRLAEVENY